jgi:hypothetical protein
VLCVSAWPVRSVTSDLFFFGAGFCWPLFLFLSET